MTDITMQIRISIIAGFSLALMAGWIGVSLPVSASPESLEEGREIVADRKRGNCYTCHQMAGAELAGDVAPPLVQMKMRYPDAAVLRAQIADPRMRNPNTVMPPYGAHGILTEREIDRVVDYLLSL